MKIYIPVNLYQKLRAYVTTVPFEISGLGKIRLENNSDFHIEELRIFRQTVSYTNTKLDRKDLLRFYDELIQNEEDPSLWKLWWHSHAKMDTFWSATDIATIDDFDTERDEDNWMLSIETNHSGSVLTRVDIFRPVRTTIEKIPWDIDFNDRDVEDNAFVEVMTKVLQPENKKKDHKATHILLPGEEDVFPPVVDSLLDHGGLPFDIFKEERRQIAVININKKGGV